MLGSCLAAGAGACVAAGLLGSKRLPRNRKPRHSRVAVLRVDSYSDRLLEVLMQGLKLFDLKIGGKSVLLKPNLVDVVSRKQLPPTRW